ncbi:MAG: SpoIID/LytB domain-containing protein [Candidatus Gracilibacteria bacterium]
MKTWIFSVGFVTALALVFLSTFAVSREPTASAHINGESRLELDQKATASVMQVNPVYEEEKLFVSKVYETDKEFELLGLNWQQSLPIKTSADLEIRFRSIDGIWTDFQPVVADTDGKDGKGEESTLWTYVVTDKSNAFQYRAHLSSDSEMLTPKISNISFDYVSGGETSTIKKLKKMIFSDETGTVSREDWGADESLRLSKTYNLDDNSGFESELDVEETATDPEMEIVKRVDTDENGNALLWPEEYPAEVKKIIIHHTASSGTISDPEATIRAIYYYHAVTRGWGDIGYNFIVGPDGKVYEGRAGGDGVVGGHASGYNTGSVGISLLGNFEDNPVSKEMMQGLMGLVLREAEKYDIDPDGTGTFRDEKLDNILGHKDVAATACPGKYAYAELTDIRDMVALSIKNASSKNSGTSYAYEEVGDRELTALSVNGEATVTLKLKNTGTKTWGKDTFLTVNANSESDDIIEIPKDSQKRTAFMKQSSVAPGKIATFEFDVSSEMNSGLASFDAYPVFDGKEKSKKEMDLAFYVETPVIEFSTVKIDSPSSLKPGESYTITAKLKNTSDFSWENSGANPLVLKVVGSSSLASGTLAKMTESEVKNGETATFTFKIKAPTKAGTYTLYFAPEMQGSDAVSNSSAQLSVKVSASTDDAIVSEGSSGSDLSFTPGEVKTLYVTVKNNSTKSWTTSGTGAFKLVFSSSGGSGSNTLKAVFKKLSVQKVSPDVSVKAYFTVTAPTKAGSYTLSIKPRTGNTSLAKSAYTMKITVAKASFTETTYENPIRIKLTPESGVGTPILTSDSDFAVYADDELLKVFTYDSSVKVAMSSTAGTGTFSISSGTNKWTKEGPIRLVPEENGIMEITTMEQRPAWDIALNDNTFRGTIEVRAVDGETVLINELALEDYMKGIGEVSNSDPTEKIKTIMVAARTYAAYYISGHEKYAGKPYNLDDDPSSSQKYLGYGFELRSPNVTKAVEETEGLVVKYDGELVVTPYFSQSDGIATKSAKEVWGWDAPWLVSVPDTFCDSTVFAGHGVGLSGCGATALARSGKTFEEILKYYYTGVTVEKL